MRIGIYIGSFNPPHLGHKKVIDFLIEKKYVDKILIVPTPSYWNKTDLVNMEDRINMLRYYENENVKVDTAHNNFPYTYQVLNSLIKDYDKNSLYLIIGSDNLEKFHEWKNIDEILKYNIIILKRGKIIKNKNVDDTNFIYIDEYPFIDISSTEIRNGDFRFIDPNIKNYIVNNRLYIRRDNNEF